MFAIATVGLAAWRKWFCPQNLPATNTVHHNLLCFIKLKL